MLVLAPLFIVLVILVLRPFMARERERNVAKKLKDVHDPAEAMLIMDNAINASKREGTFMAKMRESYFFWLH